LRLKLETTLLTLVMIFDDDNEGRLCSLDSASLAFGGSDMMDRLVLDIGLSAYDNVQTWEGIEDFAERIEIHRSNVRSELSKGFYFIL